MPQQKGMTKAAQREATIERLVAVAREHFAEAGYAGAAAEEIVASAGVTRGALYHHFGSKEGLFRAVVEDVQADVGRRVDAAASASADLWEQLLLGCRAFLSASLDPQVRRIMLVDAPAVLGWETWRAMDEANSMRLLRDLLGAMMSEGSLSPQPVDALTHLLSGAMNELALWIATTAEPQQALEEATTTLEHTLRGLRK